MAIQQNTTKLQKNYSESGNRGKCYRITGGGKEGGEGRKEVGEEGRKGRRRAGRGQ